MSDPTVTGWRLDRDDRSELLDRFPPKFPDTVAEHVTLQSGTDCPLPTARTGEVIGEIDDGAGVQALVVRIGGTEKRPDGSTYHITWSLDRPAGRRAVESNDVIRALGWRPLSKPIPIRLEPARI